MGEEQKKVDLVTHLPEKLARLQDLVSGKNFRGWFQHQIGNLLVGINNTPFKYPASPLNCTMLDIPPHSAALWMGGGYIGWCGQGHSMVVTGKYRDLHFDIYTVEAIVDEEIAKLEARH